MCRTWTRYYHSINVLTKSAPLSGELDSNDDELSAFLHSPLVPANLLISSLFRLVCSIFASTSWRSLVIWPSRTDTSFSSCAICRSLDFSSSSYRKKITCGSIAGTDNIKYLSSSHVYLQWRKSRIKQNWKSLTVMYFWWSCTTLLCHVWWKLTIDLNTIELKCGKTGVTSRQFFLTNWSISWSRFISRYTQWTK